MADDTPSSLDVPDGYIADVITHLEMFTRPDVAIPKSTLNIVRWSEPDPEEYLKLFRAVGERWLWLSRLMLEPDKLRTVLSNEKNHIYRIASGDDSVGLLELDFTQTGQCEIGFLGLIPTLTGQGHGSWLMAETLDRAWRSDIERVWLHTCTLDSPFALGFYQKFGFSAFKREVSMGPDPRLLGLLPKTAGPHIPIIS